MKWTQTRSWTHEGVAFHPAAPAQFGHYASKIHNPWARCIYFTRSYTVVLVSECWIGCGMYCMCMSLSVVVVTGWVGSANKKAGSTQFFDTGTPFQSLWLCSWPTGISDNFCNLASLQVINMRTSIVSFVRGGGRKSFLWIRYRMFGGSWVKVQSQSITCVYCNQCIFFAIRFVFV